jgi:DNA-binding response OmpR family regulator
MAKRILIIDDEDDIREVTQIALQSTTGWEVLLASSGTEGIAVAEAELPDAILLDLMMPDLDGMAVLGRLKADERAAGIPVILLTAKVQAAREAPGTDAAGVIVKPFDPMTLASEIVAILGWPKPPAGREARTCARRRSRGSVTCHG